MALLQAVTRVRDLSLPLSLLLRLCRRNGIRRLVVASGKTRARLAVVMKSCPKIFGDMTVIEADSLTGVIDRLFLSTVGL